MKLFICSHSTRGIDFAQSKLDESEEASINVGEETGEVDEGTKVINPSMFRNNGSEVDEGAEVMFGNNGP